MRVCARAHAGVCVYDCMCVHVCACARACACARVRTDLFLAYFDVILEDDPGDRLVTGRRGEGAGVRPVPTSVVYNSRHAPLKAAATRTRAAGTTLLRLTDKVGHIVRHSRAHRCYIILYLTLLSVHQAFTPSSPRQDGVRGAGGTYSTGLPTGGPGGGSSLPGSSDAGSKPSFSVTCSSMSEMVGRRSMIFCIARFVRPTCKTSAACRTACVYYSFVLTIHTN